MAFRCEHLTPMGERRALNTTRMGDVVLIDVGDGVFTGREPHTHPIKAMKIPFIIAISMTPFVIAESALAQRCTNYISSGGNTMCVRTMSPEEVKQSNKYHRGKKLERMERAAESDVRRGFNSSVSLSEFRKRLDRRSDIWDAQREHRSSN